MVQYTYRFAVLTFNLFCSIEAMKESFVRGDYVVDVNGVEDKGQRLQVSLGEHETEDSSLHYACLEFVRSRRHEH